MCNGIYRRDQMEGPMKKSTNSILAVNLVFFIAISVLNFFYQKNGFIFSLKCACSIGFVLMGLTNVIYVYHLDGVDKGFCRLMLTGFVLAMLGDILIVFNFIVGAASFALGHIFFLLSYQRLKKYRKVDIGISALFFIGVGSFLLFCPLFDYSSPLIKGVCVVYAFVISAMLGKALGNLLHFKNAYAAAMAAGSILFFFSDLMLCFCRFSASSILTDYLCMGTYYPALCVLAFSIYLYGVSDKKPL